MASLQLGTVTYNIAKDWDLDTILKKLEVLKFEGVELRTGHKHGVEVGLTKAQRDEVRQKFADSPLLVIHENPPLNCSTTL